MQFRHIAVYEGDKGGCSAEFACVVADVQLTLQRADSINNNLTLEESTEIGLALVETSLRPYILGILKELQSEAPDGQRHRRSNESDLVVAFASPITPIHQNPAIYILMVVSVVGCLAVIFYNVYHNFVTFKNAHLMVWRFGSSKLEKSKVLMSCVLVKG